MREQVNSLARANISNRMRTASPPVDPLPEFLTPAEEMTLVNLYTVELLRAASELNLPTDIQATAAMFLRRFYITHSIMTYPPMSLMKTCIFFGCKAEGHYMRLSKFAGFFPNTTAEEILAAEYILCQGIRFAFDVKHPYRALEGAIMELRRLGDFDEDRVNRAHDKAREILKFSPLVTDAYFHYTPSQIMLAALSIIDDGLVERILREAFAGQGDIAKEKVSNLIESCKEMLRKEPPERKTEYWGTVSSSSSRVEDLEPDIPNNYHSQIATPRSSRRTGNSRSAGIRTGRISSPCRRPSGNRRGREPSPSPNLPSRRTGMYLGAA